MIENKFFVIVGLQPWDIEIGSNCKNIASEFAKDNKVLYVNPPLDRKTLLKDKHTEKIKKRIKLIEKGESLIKISDNLWVLYPPTIIRSVNWLPFTFLFKWFNKKNNQRLAKDIKVAINQLQFKDIILFNDSDMFRSYYMNELLNPKVSVYYSRDNLMVHKYWSKHGKTIEPELMKRYDIVTANSLYLQKLAQKHNPNSYYVGQGCDLDLFKSSQEVMPLTDIQQIPGPIIGYIGAILSHRLDIDLLVALCKNKPEWSFVFIGKEDDAFKSSVLHQLKNVYFLGLKKENELPKYLHYFDVAINPQALNDYTEANYPRKIDEYLAMGKPVVATDTTTMSIFKDVVYLGKTSEDYIALIDLALKENSSELESQRTKVAYEHTWENSTADIYKTIESELERKGIAN